MLRRAFVQAAKMSTYTTDKASPFTRAVISSMRKLYDQARSLASARDRLMLWLLADILKHWQIRASITLDVGFITANRSRIELTRWAVLLEAPFDPIRRQMNSVLLTIDLTKAVADEAIERKDCVVVSYRMHIQGHSSQQL